MPPAPPHSRETDIRHRLPDHAPVTRLARGDPFSAKRRSHLRSRPAMSRQPMRGTCKGASMVVRRSGAMTRASCASSSMKEVTRGRLSMSVTRRFSSCCGRSKEHLCGHLRGAQAEVRARQKTSGTLRQSFKISARRASSSALSGTGGPGGAAWRWRRVSQIPPPAASSATGPESHRTQFQPEARGLNSTNSP